MASIIMHDHDSADFDDETLAIVEFVEKLTREPSEMTEGDVQKLRQVELEDKQILSVVLIASMFAFMNRLADGLGVEIEDQKGDFVDSWLKNPQGGKSWLNHRDPVVVD